MKYLWRGVVPYETALQDQLQLLNSNRDEVWGLEHPKVITLGLRAEADGEVKNDFFGSPEVIRVDRGGQATLHNQGQLVIYPQFTLNNYQFGVRTYVQALIQVTGQLLTDLKVEFLKDKCEVGLFTATGKIGAVGIRVHHGRCYHGLALNVCNDLEDFNAIRSCGIWNRPHDKLQNWGINLTPEEVFNKWVVLWQNYLQSIILNENGLNKNDLAKVEISSANYLSQNL